MGKFTTYLLLMSGISVLLYFMGLVDSNPLLDLLLKPQNMSTGTFYATLIGATAIGVGAIVVGLATKNIELAAMTAVIPTTAALLWNFVDVAVKLYSINSVLAVLIFGPFFLLFIFTLLDFWRGRDQ